MKKTIILLSVIPLLGWSQKDAAPKQIRELKNTMLLVRLKTGENQIKAYKEAGYMEKASELEAKIGAENREIASAFRDHFDFCPVYFFYSSASKAIRERKTQGKLLDDGLKPVGGIARPVPTFYIAEFGNIEKTDEKYYESTELRENQEGNKVEQDVYYGSPDMGFSALVMRDDDFVQLRDPFPYYVRTFESLPIFKRKKSKAVMKLNKKLHEYYNTTILSRGR